VDVALKRRCKQRSYFTIITQNNGHDAAQCYSRSPLESTCVTSCILSCTVCKIWQIIGPIFAVDRGVSVFDALVPSEPLKSLVRNLAWRNKETPLYRMVFWYIEPFRRDLRVWQTVGQTDGRSDGWTEIHSVRKCRA